MRSATSFRASTAISTWSSTVRTVSRAATAIVWAWAIGSKPVARAIMFAVLHRGASRPSHLLAGERRAVVLGGGLSPRVAAGAKRARGFTLLEMLAVILLIGIAAAAVSISVTQGLASARINAASSELAGALRATRAQAIVRGQDQNFDVD